MSVQSRPDSDRCKECNQRIDDYYSPGYCSPLCYHQHQGNKLLNTLRHDHTQCAMCGTKLKEVEEPTDEQLRQIDGFHSTTAVVGFQYRTPAAETGEKDIISDIGERVVTGTICSECGSTNTATEFPEIQNRFLFEYAAGVLDALDEKKDEHNTDIDRQTFFEMLLATEDMAFALGKAAQK